MHEKETTNDEKYPTSLIVLILISLALIIFSFFAPRIFISPSLSNNLNFSNTGQIGDTIGGIMNPFIAIAGVITTFLAFLMQVRANEIQKKQFQKTLQKEKENERDDARYTLEILKLDIESIIKIIETNGKSLGEFITSTKKDQFRFNTLYRTPYKQIDRARQTPRQLLYRGFVIYIKPTNKDWTKYFHRLWNDLDFVYDMFNQLYDIVRYHQEKCFKIKCEIKEQLIKLGKDSYAAFIKNDRKSDFYSHLHILINTYKKELSQSLTENKDGNFSAIKESLDTFIQNTGHFYDPSVHNEINELISSATHILKNFNDIIQATNQLIPELEKIKSPIYDKTNSSLSSLRTIKGIIEKGLKDKD